MKPYQIFSLENIVSEVNGVLYTEEWRDIDGYGGVYKISSFGRVKSIERVIAKGLYLRQHIIQPEFIMKPHPNQKGYLLCNFHKKGVGYKHFQVHRLVGLYFIDNPEGKSQINHKFEKTDNHFSQLEWTTALENQHDAIKRGLRRDAKGEGHWAYGTKGHPSMLKNRRRGSENYKSKLVIDLSTGIFYETIGQAAIAKGITDYTTFSEKLSGKKFNNTTFIYA